MYQYGVEGSGNTCPLGTQLSTCRLSLSFSKFSPFVVGDLSGVPAIALRRSSQCYDLSVFS